MGVATPKWEGLHDKRGAKIYRRNQEAEERTMIMTEKEARIQRKCEGCETERWTKTQGRGQCLSGSG